MSSSLDRRRAQVITGFGGPDLFTSTRFPLSPPGRGQVLVEVAAAAVNPVDLSTRSGLNIPVESATFPMVLGWDVAGTVVAVGPDASGDAHADGTTTAGPVGRLRVGTPVAAMTFQPLDQNGTYADYVVLDAALVVEVPGSVALVQAASVPLAGLTAAQLLNTVALPAGATLVVNGALGAVGAYVVQLARRQQLHVVAVVRPDRRQEAAALGAAESVGPDELSRRTGSVDGAIDLVGGGIAHQALNTIRNGGSYVTSVPPYINPTGPFDATRGINPAVLTVAPNRDQLIDLLRLTAAGELATPIDRTFPLTRAAAAHEHVAAGHLHGKVVLVP